MQILNDPTHPMRQYFDSRCNNRCGRVLLPKAKTNKASNLPSALSVFNENYNTLIDFNPMCTCVRTSTEEDNFQRLFKGGRMCALNSFI